MFIIDAHEDLAYNSLTFGRDYRLAAHETRRREQDSVTVQRTGQALIGWPEYQRGQVAVVFGTLFTSHRRYAPEAWDTQMFENYSQARLIYNRQLDFYQDLCDQSPDKFRMVRSKKELAETLQPWLEQPADGENITHPVGLVMLMENAEGVEHPEELEEYWQRGLRLIGPVWSGGRFCGGTNEPGGFTSTGWSFLEVMADMGFTMDISHMNEQSALQALDKYPGPVIASHANARAMSNFPGERQLTDVTIARLVERGGVMGVIPFNRFLRPEWQKTEPRSVVRLEHLAAHIDHICQIAGDAQHAALGTDFDGGFGWPAVPEELDTIADLQKLTGLLADKGFSQNEAAGILGENWRRVLENTLPAK